MTRESVLQEIADAIKLNNQAKVAVNEALSHAANIIRKDEKEEAKESDITIGDIVICSFDDMSFEGTIYMDIDVGYWVIPNDKTAPKLLSKSVWTFRKTGKHTNIESWFE